MCECKVVVAPTLTYPHNWPLTAIHFLKTRTLVCIAASIIGALRPRSSGRCARGPRAHRPLRTTNWIFFSEKRRRIDRDFKSFPYRDWVP